MTFVLDDNWCIVLLCGFYVFNGDDAEIQVKQVILPEFAVRHKIALDYHKFSGYTPKRWGYSGEAPVG